MKISVIVCTHNRYDDLGRTLNSLVSQDYPVSDYEVIVVDNCSTDMTKDVVDEFIKRDDVQVNVRYIFEEKIGLSHARNRGIEESRGDIIAFIDDDAMADRTWLSNLAQVYSEEKDAGCVGGRVMLDWSVEKPSWWHSDLDEVFNGINYSDTRIVLTHPRYPYGTNISFKIDMVRKLGGFKTDLGRIGSRLLAGEETELCLRIEKAGYKVFYNPVAIVFHKVDSKRLNESYIKDRAFWHGRSHALIELQHKKEEAFTRSKEFVQYVKEYMENCVNGITYHLKWHNRYLFFAGYLYQYLKSQEMSAKNDIHYISIIIPTFNRGNLIITCLETLSLQTYPKGLFEIIVVDDGSTDSTQALIKDFITRSDLNIVYMRKENGGPAAARNMGIKSAKGELVAFTDDDCEPDKDWLMELNSWFLLDNNIGGVGGEVKSKGNDIFSRYIDHYRFLNPKINNDEVIYLVTANACYRKTILLNAGGFEETIRNPGGEDPDLSCKIRELGYKLIYYSKAIVYHNHKQTVKAFYRMFYNYGRGEKFLHRKWGAKYSAASSPNNPLLYTMNILFIIRRYLWYRKNKFGKDSLPYAVLAYVQRIAFGSGFMRGY